MEKKYNFVYQTTNLVNGKIYIGVHSTNNLDDGYIGSGKRFSDAKKCYGVENFKREILDFFDTREECYQREAIIVDSEFILRKDNYNITEGGYGVRTHSSEGLQKLSDFAKNKAIMKDADGNIIRIDKDSSDFTDDLVGHTKGMVCAKDSNGKEVFISKDEFENNDELVGRTKGQMSVISIETGKVVSIKNNDYDRLLHKRFTTGKATVKNKDGETFQVLKDDPRILSGELVGVMKGRTYKHSKKRKTIVCPHCNKEGVVSNMKRWHYDNCKFKETV